MRHAALLAALLPVVLASCSTSRALPAQQPPLPPAGSGSGGVAVVDTLDPNFVPTGFGSLRQDDIALKLSPTKGLQVRAVPLDERWIRLLSPDSYRTLREQINSKQRALEAVMDRERLPSYSIWSVSFNAIEQGETRFSPREFIITNVGRDFRPIDILPLSTGFGEYRLMQRETQSALFIFDGQLDLNQPLTAQMESTPSITVWGDVIRRVERERSLVRSRAAAKSKVPPPPP
ncbi:MAG TPA: hypothetical protein VE869_10450 [Gemmatimonas sp.]|nr:hypothetical protein [Gemmatimonas sp.]